MIPLLILVFISFYYAWRYSRTTIDPDWALFNLPGFTGAHYGRDFVDCKTPAVHYWYWTLTRLVGRSVPNVKFIHHLLVGYGGILIYLLTGNAWNGIAFAVLINSGFLLAFHGNVGQIPAVCVAVAIGCGNPYLAAAMTSLAVLYEPKLLPSVAAMMLIYGWWLMIPFGLMGIILLLCMRKLRPAVFCWLWESSVTIPRRMKDKRTGKGEWVPWYTSFGMLYILPWVIAAVWARPDVLYWIPPVLYLLLTGVGGVIRPNHLLPLVAWIAMAGISPEWVLALWAVDWLSAGLYLGNIWHRFYLALEEPNQEAKIAGEWLKPMEGDLWVSGIHTGVYVYAQKPPTYGMTEQIEVRSVAFERRRRMVDKWSRKPPKWIALTMQPELQLNPQGYQLVYEVGDTKIGRKL